MFSVNWNPRSRQDWITILNSLAPKPRWLLWTYFAAQCWSLWNTRNKFTIEGKFPRQPADCIFKIILSLQLWRQMQKPKDRVLGRTGGDVKDVLCQLLLFSSDGLPPATSAIYRLPIFPVPACVLYIFCNS
jgi:hypothetical protein